FLHAAAAWTPRWFNKPKFHILIHLPMHIRRFGPAILYATEGFESFNAVIRDHSVHSNHQAPSRDIARGFARCNRNRHLLSKGVFLRPELSVDTEPVTYLSDNIEDWITAGPGVSHLVRPRTSGKNPVVEAFSLNADLTAAAQGLPGQCIVTSKTLRDQHFTTLKCFEWFPNCFGTTDPSTKQFNVFFSAVSVNLEAYSTGDHVIITGNPGDCTNSLPVVACVREIVQICGSGGPNNLASVILVDAYDSTTISPTYKIPCLKSSQKLLVAPTDVLCRINVQHDCANNACDLSDKQVIMEEQEKTGKTVPRTHHYNPSDLLLNTNQMRNGIYIQTLHPSILPLDQEQAILSGATHELEQQKA
ncbi:hypothetical protein EV361DRAFT_874900, partial [Lentinula raphanica]